VAGDSSTSPIRLSAVSGSSAVRTTSVSSSRPYIRPRGSPASTVSDAPSRRRPNDSGRPAPSEVRTIDTVSGVRSLPSLMVIPASASAVINSCCAQAHRGSPERSVWDSIATCTSVRPPDVMDGWSPSVVDVDQVRLALEALGGDAGDEEALRGEEQHQHRDHADGGTGHHQVELGEEFALEECE